MATQSYNDSEPVNLGTGIEISIRNLVTLICELMEFDGQSSTKPINPMVNTPLFGYRTKLAFGFVAQVDFKQGLRNTIDWYRQNAALMP